MSVQKNTKTKYQTLSKGVRHASLYWGHSPYNINVLSEDFLDEDLLCGM